jgi:hypothetical protein
MLDRRWGSSSAFRTTEQASSLRATLRKTGKGALEPFKIVSLDRRLPSLKATSLRAMQCRSHR